MATEPEEEHSHWHEDEGGPVKSFLDHLEDFRWALIKSCAGVAIGVIICLVAGNHISEILMRPLHKAYAQYNGTNQVVVVSYGEKRIGVLRPNGEQSQALHLGSNRLTSMELTPVTITNGTNPVTLL